MSERKPALSVDIQSKHYRNGLLALENVRFEAKVGEILALVGPSGAGKTTLLNMIAGLDGAFVGKIENDGVAGSQGVVQTAFMFQEPRLMPWLTVWDNVALVIPAAERSAYQERIVLLLQQAGLAEFAHVYPKQLSGGMRRRVALVRAFVGKPSLLLMDEPFQSLDAPTAGQLYEILLQLWQETRPTVLFVTHSLREALMLADRVLFLSTRPARVILEYPVMLARPRLLEGEAVQSLYQGLLQQYPKLLAGSL